jgi:L-seryl-tRNA(Ser) seleniumtransferase
MNEANSVRNETNPLRRLPAVSRVLEEAALVEARQSYGLAAVTAAVRQVLAEMRQRMQAGQTLSAEELAPAHLARQVLLHLQRQWGPSLRPVINATGIVLHTNLGRAPLSEAAAQAAYEAARSYVNLELDLHGGQRSHRQEHVRQALCRLSGAEWATVVNNCAAATILVLRAVAGGGKEVLVSRGQLIEIGGSFRIPEIMAVSGATLREVGTTNITRLSDYERAAGPQTAAAMRIHTSNYRLRGFTRTVALEDLVSWAHRRQLAVIDDIGSGLAVDLSPWGLTGEPILSASIRAGADLVVCSGDKLLGGPQAGLILGRKEWLERIERDPFFRAVRPDKMTLAALAATLQHYEDPALALNHVPVLRLLTTPAEQLQVRCQSLLERLQSRSFPAAMQVLAQTAYAGGGSLPEIALPTYVLQIRPHQGSEEEWAYRLRTGEPPVIARRAQGCLWLDLRTVFPYQEDMLIQRLCQVAQTLTEPAHSPKSAEAGESDPT